METFDAISLLATFIGILITIIAIFIAYKINKNNSSVQVVSAREKIFQDIFSKSVQNIDFMGLSLKGFISNYYSEIARLAEKGIKIRILILNPNSFSFFKIAEQETHSSNIIDYRNFYLNKDIEDSKNQVSKLMQHYNNIEIRFYEELPMTFIISEKFAYVEPYHSPEIRQIESLDRPVIIKIDTKKGKFLKEALQDVFNKIWENALPITADSEIMAKEEINKFYQFIERK